MSIPKISVIIPVYNAETWLDQCIRSVKGQTLREIEIIIVNDGSTDGSGKIIEKHACHDNRILVINNQNKGVSVARNAGMAIAKGAFIGFVDADDWIEPGMYEKLYSEAKARSADLVICNIQLEREEQPAGVRLELHNALIDLDMNRCAELRNFMQFRYDNANWNKLYSTNIIKEHKIAFNEEMILWEDLLFNLVYLQFASKVAICEDPLYHYRIHKKSLSGSESRDIIGQYNLLYKYYVEFANKNELRDELEVFRSEMARGFYNQIIDIIEKKNRKKYSSILKFLSHFKNDIRKIEPGICAFPEQDMKGFQGFKRSLLKNRHYLLFSAIIAMKIFFGVQKQQQYGND